MKIVVDAMGGDHAPQAVVAGVVEAIREFKITVTLVGIRSAMEQELSKYEYPKDRIELVHADEVVDMHDSPIAAIRKKRNSSITIGLGLLKDPQYNAFVSAGNTGAVVAASTFVLGMLPGVERPAIGLVLPTLNRFAFLIDVGANADPKAQHLFQSAVMARVYTQHVLNVTHPKTGLLNIGEESSKGTDFQKETYKLMESLVPNFIGNIEPNEIFTGKCDCIICDGFTGNILIKVSEGLMESASTLMRREIKKSPIALIGALLMKPRMMAIKKYADYSEYGGAPLLGVNGIVMIGHGRSSPKAVKNAIRAAMKEIEHDILTVMANEIKH